MKMMASLVTFASRVQEGSENGLAETNWSAKESRKLYAGACKKTWGTLARNESFQIHLQCPTKITRQKSNYE